MSLTHRLALFLLTGTLVLISVPALAGNTLTEDCPRVEAALHLTNQVLRVTGSWLEECSFLKADSVFQQALRLQHRARQLFREERCRLAFEHTQASRRHAFEAVILCFRAEGLCLRTRAAVARTGKAIQVLDTLIRECDIPEARCLFMEGVEFERKAIYALQESHCPPALELTLIARALIFKAAYLCHSERILAASVPEFGDASLEQPPEIDTASSKGLLKQNSPNPFNAQTTIYYVLPSDSKVSLTVYNIRGQKVNTLVDEFQFAGEKQINWDGSNESGDKVASGVYFYRIQTDQLTEVRRMVFLK